MAGHVDKKLESIISPATINNIHLCNGRLSTRRAYPNKVKYSRKIEQQKIWFLEGYDLMQYNLVVRPYILRRFNIEKDVYLDVLLYLFPIQFFSYSDFKVLPVRGYEITLKLLIEKNYLEVSLMRSKPKAKVYALTDLARKIVVSYYQYLSGEKKISPDHHTNPFKELPKRRVDLQRQRLMEDLADRSRKNPELFKGRLY